jgi:molybdate transport system permease protein
MIPSRPRRFSWSAIGFLLASSLVLLLALPMVALTVSTAPADLRAGFASPLFLPSLWLSLRTTVVSIAIIVVTGSPLAWWLASSTGRTARVVELIVDLPIVIPPAVVGVALLRTFGRRGLLGPGLDAVGVSIPFTEVAVILAQIVVAAAFFVQAAANAFRKIDPDLIGVARTLGASPTSAFFRVAVPVAMPGLITGASLAWARALGEFGATLLFAGNLTGSTQTMPLAIFSALETDVRIATVLSLVLAAMGILLLLSLRLASPVWSRWGPGRRSEPQPILPESVS